MRKWVFSIVLCLCCAMVALGDDVQNEKMGKDTGSRIQATKTFKGVFNPNRAAGYLLIPESTNDSVGMYDPYDGTYLGDVIDNSAGLFSTPINAVLGPDGNIYVSDQVADSVFVYDTSGNYLLTYADSTDGLDNIRGICFRGPNLCVSTAAGEIAEFSGPHSRLPDFIYDSTASYFDVHFLNNGECLVCDINNNDVAHYDANGVMVNSVIPVDFPEQVQFDSSLPGEYLVNVFMDKLVHDFEINGTIHQTAPHGMYGRGVYRLGNGNLLVTSSGGVDEIDPLTGVVIQNENVGSHRFIEYAGPTNTLTCDVTSISEFTGGQANFTLDAGVANANRSYLIFAGVSGTTPGFTPPPGLVTIPINWDIFTNLALKLTNTTIFSSFYGTLDLNGQSAAVFDTLGPFSGGVGLTISFAYGVDISYWDFASNAVNIDIVP